MDVYEAIRARRTIRDFNGRQVGMDALERIIAAGLKAPTNNHLRKPPPGKEHDQPGRVRKNARRLRHGG